MATVKVIGRLFSAAIAREVTRGSASSVGGGYWIPFSEAAFEEKFENALDNQSQGVIEDSIGQTRVKDWAEASLKAPISDKSFPLILYATLGTLNSAVNPDASGIVYDHTVTVAQNVQHQSLTLFLNDPAATGDAQDKRFANGVLDSLEINYAFGEFLNYAATFKSQKGTAYGLTPSTVTENRFLSQHVTFKLAPSLATLGTAASIKVRMLTLKITPNVVEDLVLGSRAPNDWLNKEMTIEGTVEALWDDEATFRTATLAGSASAMRIDLKNTDVTIGTAANPEIQLDLAKVIFKEITRPLKLNDLVMQTLQFKAHYSIGDSKAITVKCTNLVASY